MFARFHKRARSSTHAVGSARTVVLVAAGALPTRVTHTHVRFRIAVTVTRAVDVYAGTSIELTELKIISNQII